MVCSKFLTILAVVPAVGASILGAAESSPATAAPAPGQASSKAKGSSRLDKLRKKLPAKVVAVENPCLPGSAAGSTACPRALDRTLAKLEALASGKNERVRVLHLGDSHIASDYITGEIRRALQIEYGDAGRGFVQADQPLAYGGRRKTRTDRDWELDRIVDTGRAGRPYGFSGISLESKRKGALVSYQLMPEDETVRIYYQAQPGGARLAVKANKKPLGEIDTAADVAVSRVAEFTLAEGEGKKPAARKKKPGLLELVADNPKARLYGVSFERSGSGLLYDAIGPVGADAKVYLELDRRSFVEHLALHRPQLVVLMVGGNDALKIRKEWTDLTRVRKDHEDLIDVLKSTIPDVECLLWSPMDAGERQGKRVVSRSKLEDVRALQREVAIAKGCGFWDFYESMGGQNAIAAWHKAGVMNADLVHPKALAADLLGSLFVEGLDQLRAATRPN